MPNIPSWLTARPIAHRGLHDSAVGIIENTLPAFAAAIERGFAIELDVQPTRDGDAVAFHDRTLDRLTDQTGPVADLDRAELETIMVTGSGLPIPSLAKVLAEVDGRTPLFIELKSNFDGDVSLASAVAGALAAYPGPAALMSFDPHLVTELRKHTSGRPLGFVSASMSYDQWGGLSFWKRFSYSTLLNGPGFWCDFVSYSQACLPAVAPLLAKWIGRKALITWTVKDAANAKRLTPYVDAITFEGFDPLEDVA